MIENHAAMKWECLANEYLKERDECLALATKNRETADSYRQALEQIDIMAGNALGKSVLEIEDDLATIQTLIRNRLHF